MIAAAVLAASEHQRSTAQTNFDEAQAAAQMQTAMLGQERGLDAFLADEQPSSLQQIYESRLRLDAGLAAARKLARDDTIEQRAVSQQAVAFRRWSTLATAAIRRKQATGRDDSAGRERTRGRTIDAFLVENDAYQARLLVNRYREERDAALYPVWALLALGAFFAAVGGALAFRSHRIRTHREAAATSQARFGEAIQFAADEREAHQLLTSHLERSLPGSSVLVLNRNNSADRLEPSPELPANHPLAKPLLDSRPRSCLAVRLSRRFDRDQDGTAEALTCQLCGNLEPPSSCQPLLVGGEVIGSVLVARRESTRDDDAVVELSVNQAAPVIANLRNLAIAESRAVTDTLTGLPNRRAVDDTLRQMTANADRTMTKLSVALLDLDHFKQINDLYGHERGDNALAATGALLRNELRASDFAGRSGGEEFILFLPGTDREGAVGLADKVRRAFHEIRIPGLDGRLTASFGVATFPDDAVTPVELMRVADRALYAAKQAGRDRVNAIERPDPGRADRLDIGLPV